MIFDTNILIYLSKYTVSLQTILSQPAKISVITKIEALGYKFENLDEHQFLVDICNELPVIAISDAIVDATIDLRINHKIKLPDAVIYATALVEGLPLLTSNTDDFKKLGNKVKLIDPFNL